MKKMRLFMLWSLLMVCLSGFASAHDWEWVYLDVYYSRDSAVRLNDNWQAGERGHVKAWVQHRIENDNLRQKIKKKYQARYSDCDFSNVYKFTAQQEFKNVNGTICWRYLKWYAYDRNGNLIKAIVYDNNNPEEWKLILPGTYGMTMYEHILARAK